LRRQGSKNGVLEADKIFINVGGRAFVPPMPRLDQIDYLTNSSMMHVDYLPEHLIIIGGSYIGLEFAQMYRRFGSQVIVTEKGSRLIARDIDGQAIGSGAPGQVTQKLQKRYWEMHEDPRFTLKIDYNRYLLGPFYI
jgi:pyruvate/2-oxoglutarate dehydrogenase complex dihydrolipoamide dehydrogenase (E3) component